MPRQCCSHGVSARLQRKRTFGVARSLPFHLEARPWRFAAYDNCAPRRGRNTHRFPRFGLLPCVNPRPAQSNRSKSKPCSDDAPTRARFRCCEACGCGWTCRFRRCWDGLRRSWRRDRCSANRRAPLQNPLPYFMRRQFDFEVSRMRLCDLVDARKDRLERRERRDGIYLLIQASQFVKDAEVS
jgi:hypothetical protein